MKKSLALMAFLLFALGFIAPTLWIPALIIGIVAIGMRPEGLRADGRPRTGGLFGWLWDDVAVAIRRNRPVGITSSPGRSFAGGVILVLIGLLLGTAAVPYLLGSPSKLSDPTIAGSKLPPQLVPQTTSTGVSDPNVAPSTSAPQIVPQATSTVEAKVSKLTDQFAPEDTLAEDVQTSHPQNSSPVPKPRAKPIEILMLSAVKRDIAALPEPSAPLASHQGVQSEDKGSVFPFQMTNSIDKGDSYVLDFQVEVARFLKVYPCPQYRQSLSPGVEGLGPMFGCVDGVAQTAKYWINASHDGKTVENIKVMWNDWREDGGYGRHADKKVARQMVDGLSQLYMPAQKAKLQQLFAGRANGQLATNRTVIAYSFKRGPQIDERLLTVKTTMKPGTAVDELPPQPNQCTALTNKVKSALPRLTQRLDDLKVAVKALKITMSTTDQEMKKIKLAMTKVAASLLTVEMLYEIAELEQADKLKCPGDFGGLAQQLREEKDSTSQTLALLFANTEHEISVTPN